MTKRVLVTGGAGFVGSYVIDLLLKKTDWDIVSLDRLNYSGNLNRLHETISEHSDETKKRLSIIFHDFKAPISGQVKSAIGDINIILHIGANSHVDHSISDPVLFLLDNTHGTVNMLEYARELPNLECFYYFSTDETLGPNDPNNIFDEHSRINPQNPYAAAKLGGEAFCVAYHNTYKIPVIISRCMNIFGMRQAPEKFIPLCIRNVRDEKPIYIHANKTCTEAGARIYIHGSDVADAVLFLLTDSKVKAYIESIKNDVVRCPLFHIVGPKKLDNLILAQTIAEIQGKPLDYTLINFHESRPGHDLFYMMEGTLMKRLGWESKRSTEERLKETVEWSLANERWLNV